MTDSPLALVSVVIPSYNHAHLITRALQSVQRQEWRSWEVLVVDNHSTDDTDAVLAPFLSERVRLLKIHNNGIIAASRNLGIREARGEWVAFLDSDDWWTDDKLSTCMRLALDGADVVFHDLAMVGANGKAHPWRRSRSRAVASPAYEDLVRNGNALPNSSVVARKSLLLEIGGLREERDLVGWEDYDGWLRLAGAGARLARAEGVHGYYWIGGGSVSNPRRTLANIDAFLVRHTAGNIPWWCHYARGVAFHALCERDKVTPAFSAAWRTAPGLLNRIRIACKWLLAR